MFQKLFECMGAYGLRREREVKIRELGPRSPGCDFEWRSQIHGQVQCEFHADHRHYWGDPGGKYAYVAIGCEG